MVRKMKAVTIDNDMTLEDTKQLLTNYRLMEQEIEEYKKLLQESVNIQVVEDNSAHFINVKKVLIRQAMKKNNDIQTMIYMLYFKASKKDVSIYFGEHPIQLTEDEQKDVDVLNNKAGVLLEIGYDTKGIKSHLKKMGI